MKGVAFAMSEKNNDLKSTDMKNSEPVSGGSVYGDCVAVELPPTNPASAFSASCFDWLESIVQAIVFVTILMTFFVRLVNVEGTSMLNTLFNADKVLVLKYGYVPKKNDVVVITPVNQVDVPIIKRVIATEGDTLSIDFSDGSVYVNGEKLNETYIKERMWVQGDGEIPSVIPEGYCFVMGDNRNHSLDSRFKELGLVPNDRVVGNAKVIVYPFDRFGVIK